MNAWLDSKDPEQVADLIARLRAQSPDRIEAAHGDERYAVWLVVVDRAIGPQVGGLTHSDLPDWGWRDAYDDDLAPRDAAADALAHWQQFGDL